MLWFAPCNQLGRLLQRLKMINSAVIASHFCKNGVAIHKLALCLNSVDFSLVSLTQNDKGFVVLTYLVILSDSEVSIQNTENGLLKF